MNWNTTPMGPYMMAQPQSPQVIYVPMPTPTGMPPFPPAPGQVPVKSRPMSLKKMEKVAARWNKVVEDAKKGSDKKDDKKDKKITEKMFTFFETCLLLVVTSIPVGLTLLIMLKTAMSVARSL